MPYPRLQCSRSTVIVVALSTGHFAVSDDTVSMLTALARASKTQLNAARLANRGMATDARARLRAVRADEGYTVRRRSRSRRRRPDAAAAADNGDDDE
jgi:hypothetical protein